MLFKKLNSKKILKENKRFMEILRKKFPEKKRFYDEDTFFLLKKSIGLFIDNCFANNMLLFAIKTDKYGFGSIEDSLNCIHLLEFAYSTKKNNDYYLIIAIKGLIGYNECLINNFYSSTFAYSCASIKYLKNKKKALEYFNFLVEDSDFENNYCFKANYLKESVALGGKYFYNFFSTEEEFPYFEDLYQVSKTTTGLKLKSFNFGTLSQQRAYKYIYFYNKEYNKELVIYNEETPLVDFDNEMYKDHILFLRNDKDIVSRKKADELSIINLWIIYMKGNNLYIKDSGIYEKKYSGEIKYISELSYLKYNMKEILIFVKKYFSFQLDGYPIENIITKYLGSAYDKLLVNPYYYLPYLEEEILSNLTLKVDEVCDKLRSLEENLFSEKASILNSLYKYESIDNFYIDSGNSKEIEEEMKKEIMERIEEDIKLRDEILKNY